MLLGVQRIGASTDSDSRPAQRNRARHECWDLRPARGVCTRMSRRSPLATILEQLRWPHGGRVPRLGGAVGLLTLGLVASVHAAAVPVARAVVIDSAVRDSMNSI